MYSFENDYSEGCHPKILKALTETNLIQTVGYGNDEYCHQASEQLKKIVNNQNIDIHYLVGGTQTNMIMIAAALKPYQAVIAADSGHINVHETGAIESTGHKVLTRPHKNGKLTVEMIEDIIDEHPDEHMVQPKMVYISQSTEYGTVYTKEEVKNIYEVCQKHHIYLFIDGARLGSALVIEGTPNLEELVTYSDCLYIGGTKMGALFGECLVIKNDALKPDFRYYIKQKGALLAKGRLLGVQFLELFKDDLYLEIGRHEVYMAQLLKEGLEKAGVHFFIDSPTNQLFPVFTNKMIDELSKSFRMTFMFNVDDKHKCMRLVTSFATQEDKVQDFIQAIERING